MADKLTHQPLIPIETPMLNKLHKALVEDAADECYCPKCKWSGYWEDCGVTVIRATMMDPEERYATCPRCQQDVEEVDHE